MQKTFKRSNKQFHFSIVFLVTLTLITAIFQLCGCAVSHPDGKIKKLAGEWKCQETPLQNSDLYSGYLKMEIKDTGEFTMYDAEAGNPSLKGTIESITKTSMVLNCSKDEDFDPPAGWDDMKKTQKIQYRLDKDKLYLTYGEGKKAITLVFS